jgi:hypothetical protein
MDAKEFAQKVVERLNQEPCYDMDARLEQAKDAELEAARDVLEKAGIPEDQREALIEEMDGLVVFVPEFFKLAVEVER